MGAATNFIEDKGMPVTWTARRIGLRIDEPYAQFVPFTLPCEDTHFGTNGKYGADGGDCNDVLDGRGGGDKRTGCGGKDTLVFSKGGSHDRNTDLGKGSDPVMLDTALRKGDLNAKQVIRQFGEIDEGDVLLDFGRDSPRVGDLDNALDVARYLGIS